jgi:hypothetical protein
MPRVGFEPIISAGDRPQTYTLERAATAGTGNLPTLLTVKNDKLLLQEQKLWDFMETKFREMKMREEIIPAIFSFGK